MTYLEKGSLKLCSTKAGIASNSTAVKWTIYAREDFVDRYARHFSETKLSGEEEIDESPFRKKLGTAQI